MSADPIFIIASLFAALAVGMAKGGMPAISMLAVPVLSFSMSPLMAAGLLLPVYLLSDCYGMWLFRREFSVRNLKILLPAGALGTLIGYLTVTQISTDMAKLAVAAVAFYFLINQMIQRWRRNTIARSADVPRGLFWGTLAGLTSYVALAGAPPYQAYMLPQKLPKMIFAGTSTLFFAAINLMKVPAYIAAGQMTWGSFVSSAYLAPAALLGAWLAYNLTKILPERIFYALIEIALFLIALKLLWDVFAS